MPDTSANSGHFMIFQLLSHSSLKAFKKSKTYIQELKELRLCSVPHRSVYLETRPFLVFCWAATIHLVIPRDRECRSWKELSEFPTWPAAMEMKRTNDFPICPGPLPCSDQQNSWTSWRLLSLPRFLLLDCLQNSTPVALAPADVGWTQHWYRLSGRPSGPPKEQSPPSPCCGGWCSCHPSTHLVPQLLFLSMPFKPWKAGLWF